MEGRPVRLVRNDRPGASVDDVGAETVAVVALVGNGRGEGQKSRRGGNVRVVAGSEMKCAGSAIRIAQRVDFRGATTA